MSIDPSWGCILGTGKGTVRVPVSNEISYTWPELTHLVELTVGFQTSFPESTASQSRTLLALEFLRSRCERTQTTIAERHLVLIQVLAT